MRNQVKQVAVVTAARDNSVRVTVNKANTLTPEQAQTLTLMLSGIMHSMLIRMVAGEHVTHSVAVYQRDAGDLIAEYQS